MKLGEKFRRISCALLAAAVLVPDAWTQLPVLAKASDPVFTLEMAKSLGVANSPDYEKLEYELNLKEVALKNAVRSVQEKKRDLAAFRWSPLLSFKFPEQPDLSQAYEFEFKPVDAQAQIDTVKHQMTDQILAVYEDVSNLYVDIVVLQDKIDFNEDRRESMEDTLARNRVRLAAGEATASDVTVMEKALTALENKIASDRLTLDADKKKLSQAVGMDVSTGFTFVNPFVEAKITQDQLGALTEYTLERDQNYYEVCLKETTARMSVETNYSLMSDHYGGDMSYISDYVNQALDGQKVNSTAFKKSYDQFLEAIDDPWRGYFKVWFIKITKEWLKGPLSGTRYVEDEPYALYEASMEYLDARLEKDNAKTDLEQQVEEAYNNLVKVRSAYLSAVDDVSEAEKQLKADQVLNSVGELSYPEYKASLDDFEDLQNDMYDALALYSQTLYSFDRLTCGGVTELLKGTGTDLNTGNGGQSYIEEDLAGGAYYYIEPIIQEEEFRLGVSIPAEFEVDITHFELWCDGQQIGERTEIDKTLRHLMLAVDQVDEVKIRFYNDETFVDDCVIDPSVYSGPLEIVAGYSIVEGEQTQIGTYESDDGSTTGLLTITLKPDAAEQIGYYRIRTEDGKNLVGDALIPIGTPFRYPALVTGELGTLVIEFYGEDSSLKYTGYFDTGNRRLMKIPQ